MGCIFETLPDRPKLLLVMAQKSYMGFHFAPFTLIWSDLEGQTKAILNFGGLYITKVTASHESMSYTS